jgi:hypothetical protein
MEWPGDRYTFGRIFIYCRAMVETMFNAIIIRLAGVVIGSFLAAIPVWTAARWVGLWDINLSQVYRATLIVCLTLFGIEVLCLFMAGSSVNGDAVISLVRISLVPIGLSLLAGMIGWSFSVGIGKALLITLLAAIIGAVIVLIGVQLGSWIV